MADVAGKERKIMVAVDEGEESGYALSWCLKNIVMENSKDTLILLYAKPPRIMYSTLDGTGTRRDLRQGILKKDQYFTLDQSRYLFSTDIMASMERYSNEVAQSVMDKAKRLCKDLKDVKVESKVEHGDARDVICEMAEKLGADVVVLGSHGYGVIKRAFLGSVSNHCAQNIKCPVLIVKKPKCTTPAPTPTSTTTSAN